MYVTVLTTVFYYLLLRQDLYCVYCASAYVTMSISTGSYPKLDLWKANKLHYITMTFFNPCHSNYEVWRQINKTT